MKIVAFTTDDPLYFQHAQLLEASLKALGLELYLEVISADEWQKIIAFKPSFIQSMCQRFDEPILYVDADAFVHQNVASLFAGVSEDIAAHYYLDREFTSGTLFINNSDAAHDLVNEWVLEMAKDPTRWDQKVLEELVDEKSKAGVLTMRRLSAEYTYIFDRTPKYYPNVGQAVIEHLQASRESRFAKQYQSASFLKRWYLRQPWLNKRYKQLLYRRAYSQKLARSVNLTLDFDFLL